MLKTKEDFRDILNHSDVVMLNVLPAEDYARLHIKGSQNIPWGTSAEDFVEAVGSRYGKNKFFITYCSGLAGRAGREAAQALKQKGFSVSDYPGGIQEWSEAGFPTEGSEGTTLV